MNLRKSISNLGGTTVLTFCLGLAITACSADSQPSSPDVGGSAAITGGRAGTTTGGSSASSTGGSAATGGATASMPATGGMAPSTGGQPATGGKVGVGGTSAKGVGGSAASGGTKGSGGTPGTGGSKSTGGTSASAVGGTANTGGTKSIGGTNAVGGANTGGTRAAGGSSSVGGTRSVGGGSAVGGTSNGGTSTTGTATTGYCPASGACRISPLGDSITEGMGWTPPGASTWGGGYRIKLFSLGNADAKNFTFVGTRSNGPATVDGKPFPQKHEGTSGISIEDLQKNVVEAGKLTGSDVKPHIILLHIGTNNMYNTHPATPDVLMASLLDKIIAACPDALLVVAKIIPYPGNTSGIQSFNDKLPALVQERASKGAHIILVDQFTGFPTSQLSDGVHPNEQGYARMAGVWYDAISQYLH